MNKLSRADHERREKLSTTLADLKAEIEAQRDILNAKIEAFNEAVEETNGWVEDVARTIEEYIDERSEKWQESERGDAYGTWKDEWENFTLEIVDTVEEIEFEDFADLLDALPHVPED